ncbi:MAG: hypothetical protein RIR18_1342 [Pseudomonadota bacterium]|jgi:hypothetical protein
MTELLQQPIYHPPANHVLTDNRIDAVGAVHA